MLHAILDLGTNTFNLLIAESGGDRKYKIIFKEELPVKLGESGITKKIIAPVSFVRGITAIKKHKSTIEKYGVAHIQAFATSALRSAENGKDFIKTVFEETGIRINVIPGDEEATYIYKGVNLSGILNNRPSLIMDIGGGSTEFIIADHSKIFWKNSYDLGVSRLMQMFRPSDPIKKNEVTALENYLEETTCSLLDAAMKYNINTLIGCSGSFESFAEMISENFHPCKKNDVSCEIKFSDFSQLYGLLIKSDEAVRNKIKGLASMRVDTIVYAAIFVRFIISKIQPSYFIVSHYALKEGVLAGLLH